MNIIFHAEYEDPLFYYSHATKRDHRDSDYFTHYHDAFEILFVKTGDISFETGGVHFPCSRNALVFTRPSERHCLHVNRDSPYERYNILFAQNVFPADFLSRIPEDFHLRDFDSNPIVVQLFDKMDFYCRNLNNTAAGRILLHLTEEILANLILETDADRRDTEQNPLISRALSYIDSHLMSIRCLEELCGELYISKSHLHHLFLNHLDTTPKRYITEKRLQLAAKELLLGEKATEIHAKYGFSDYSAFYRAYKKYFGYSPAETRHGDSVHISLSDILKGYPD